MINELQSKLRSTLSSRVKREETVVYILLQTYKIIELDGKGNDYWSIVFYRNWVAHSSLDRDLAKRVLELVGVEGKEKYNFLGFETLRLELRKFLLEYGLESDLVDEGWYQFRKILGQIIRDQPVLKKGEAQDDEIQKICVVDQGELFENAVKYSIILGDGTDVGFSIMYADKDEHKKMKDRLVALRFDYHYMRKDFLRAMSQARALEGKEAEDMERHSDALYEQLKELKSKISELDNKVAENNFADEYYK